MNELTVSMAIALVGWLASSYALKHSALSPRWQRALITPLWIVWMVVALGGPVLNGSMPLGDATSAGAACLAGMSSYLLIASLRRSPER